MTVTAIPQAQDAAQTPAEAKTKEPRSKKKLIIIVVAVLVLGGGGYWFTRPAPSGPPKPGTVLKLDSIQINLTGEHYLRIGIALQLVAGSKEDDGSKALDTTISTFSGLPMTEVNDPAQREVLKKKLVASLAKVYDKEVMGVYFTEFVTQ